MASQATVGFATAMMPLGADRVAVDGRSYAYFGGYDYLAFAQDPKLIETAIKSLNELGLCASASRVTSGERKIYLELERALADFLGTADAALLPSGSLANIAVAEMLVGDVRPWFVDSAAHPSFMSVARRCLGEFKPYAHIDSRDFASRLTSLESGAPLGVFTDGVFPLNGDVAPIGSLISAVEKAGLDALFVIDEAHSLGVFGGSGRGSLEQFGVDPKTTKAEIILTGTLSKALGAFGGFVAGSTDRIRALRERSAAFRTSTPFPPPLAAAALAALYRLASDQSLLGDLRKNISRMNTILAANNLRISDPSVPIFSLTESHRRNPIKIAESLKRSGVIVPVLHNYSSITAGTALRWIVNRAHSDTDLEVFSDAMTLAMSS